MILWGKVYINIFVDIYFITHDMMDKNSNKTHNTQNYKNNTSNERIKKWSDDMTIQNKKSEVNSYAVKLYYSWLNFINIQS